MKMPSLVLAAALALSAAGAEPPKETLKARVDRARKASMVAAAGAGSGTLQPGPGVSVAPALPPLTPLPPAPACGTEERQQLDKLTALNMIEQQKLAQKLRSTIEEKEEVGLKNALLAEKLRSEMAPLEHEQRKLQIKGQMEDEKAGQSIAQLRFERDRLRLGNEVTREKLSSEQLKLEAEKLKLEAEKLKLEAEKLKLDADKLKFEADKLKMDVVMRDLDFSSRKLRFEAELAENKTVALKSDLDLRDKKDAWKRHANREPEYLNPPFKDGVLTISDRRIALDGPIVYGTADDVTARIDYFNNKSGEYPIFLVIDRSPGGSVMEGYRIMKAMQASKAPVYVVVKSYAASMAATIASLAPKSFAYPNAIILHHQLWSMTVGNLTQQKQALDSLKEWDRRLREPVAKKMGLDFDGFTAALYKHNVDGDWEEFADSAVKLKWIDHVVHEIRETGVLKEPELKPGEKPKLAYGLAEENDRGDRFVRLPRLQPFDAYFLYNRDSYYR